jgi:hypothetical protein
MTQTTQHYDILTTTTGDGSIRLQQMDYCGNSATIHLHPDQPRALAAEFAPPHTQTSTTPAELVLRRFKAVTDAFLDALYDEHIHDDIWKRAGCAEVLYARIACAQDLAEQFIKDSEVIFCHDNSPQCHDKSDSCHVNSAVCHDNSAAFSVTPDGKRGRPVSGQAMTDSERQAKRRAKAEQAGQQ